MSKKVGNGFADAINNVTVEQTTKQKKNNIPVLSLPDPIKKNLKNFLVYKKDMKAAESNMRIEEQPILEYCQNYLDKKALEGEYHQSYEISDGVTAVNFTTVDKFSALSTETLDQVKTILGKEYNDSIETNVSVSLKPEILKSEELQNELMKLMGDNFQKFFVATKTISLKSGFAEKMYKIAKSQDVLKKIKEIIPQTKARIS